MTPWEVIGWCVAGIVVLITAVFIVAVVMAVAKTIRKKFDGDAAVEEAETRYGVLGADRRNAFVDGARWQHNKGRRTR